MTQEQAQNQVAEIVSEFEELRDTFLQTNSIGEAGFALGSFYYSLRTKLAFLNQYITETKENFIATKN